MTKDLRDPTLLGEALLVLSSVRPNVPLSSLADRAFPVANYDANPSCLEKYGRPQDLPSTLPN